MQNKQSQNRVIQLIFFKLQVTDAEVVSYHEVQENEREPWTRNDQTFQ